jgi:hypothetical protein
MIQESVIKKIEARGCEQMYKSCMEELWCTKGTISGISTREKVGIQRWAFWVRGGGVRASEVGRQGGQGAERVPGRQHHGRKLTHRQDLTSKKHLLPTSQRKKTLFCDLLKTIFSLKTKGRAKIILYLFFYDAACIYARAQPNYN